MSSQLKSYLCGAWQEVVGESVELVNPTTEEVLATVGRGAQDTAAALAFAREVGGAKLKAMSFADRGQLLAAMAKCWHAHRNELLDLSMISGGNTRGDAKFDVDGGTGTLMAYAKIGEQLGEAQFLIDGSPIRLSRSPRYVGRHVQMPRAGVAIHINAFNFPAWGMAEKAACAILAGMPVLTKPATSTAFLAVRMMELLVEESVLPVGVLQMLVGSAGDLLDHVCGQDVVAFTGSADTGQRIRKHPAVVAHSVRVNVEADSLNSAVLGPKVKPESETWDLMVREVTTDLTQKAGQKCTAIRRVFVPSEQLETFLADLKNSLDGIRVGNPGSKGVRMGPLASRQQLEDVQAGLAMLQTEAEMVHGSIGPGTLVDVPSNQGYFQTPVLFQLEHGQQTTAVHQREVFGPAATLIPYSEGDIEGLASMLNLGAGGLVASIYSDDRTFAGAMMQQVAAFNGRLNFGSKKVAEMSMGPGAVLPQLIHGGPGRAGAGEELGGLRGMALYLQRTALQGDEPMLAEILASGVEV